MNVLKLVARNLLSRKGRFLFTLLGITIGMASFVALMSIGQNMRNEVTAQAYSLGGNFVIVPDDLCVFNQIGIITGDAISERLDFAEFEKIAAIEGLDVIPHLTRRMMIYNPTAGAQQPTTVTGILPAETKTFRNWDMYAGEYFSSQDHEAIIIGQGIMNRFDLGVGDELEVRRGEMFTVVGILASTSSNDDTNVFMPLSVAQRVFDREGSVSYMSATVDDMARFDYFYASIHSVANNVNVATNEQLLGAVLTIIGSVNVTLQAVAGVALIAAAFGIINTMMTAVYERRREIGIMRAIGGRSSVIFRIFVIESGLYGLLGGILGIVVGIIVSVFAAPIIQGDEMLMGLEAGVNIDAVLIVSAIGFSLVISILSGLFPAWKASKLTPVEAIS
ncbi:MAG: ABC transporter permease [Defluviitaleaceae bacterium]|nr:ABC transporter permease [Defluviitaleaceae bacterium]